MKPRESWIRRSLRRKGALRRRNRRGAATVELALCLPVLFVVAFGMIETSNVAFIQGRLQAAAYEAARLATRPVTSNATAATSDQVVEYGRTLLSQLGVNGAEITVTPSSLANLPPQTLVTVSISAPWKGNSPTSFLLKNPPTMTGAATLVVE